MDTRLRRRFDELLEQVLDDLPSDVMDLLETVPLVVDDYPPRKLLRELRIRDASELCGLYTGIPLGEQSSDRIGWAPETISIYRYGIICLAEEDDEPNDDALREQIRITILHEVGHHFGLDEEQLRELGYD
ncbi:MAG: metallopeptidase family protein [Pirellulales bacterium]|nr:metallopeptidase family protein [Pirellulales bacterium]